MNEHYQPAPILPDAAELEQLAESFFRHLDWRRDRAKGPAPRTRTLAVLDEWIAGRPEQAWALIETIVRLRPEDDGVLEVVWSHLTMLLERHGRAFEPRVRELVGGNERLTRIVPPARLDRRTHRPRPLDIPALVKAWLLNARTVNDAREIDSYVHHEPRIGLRLALEIISRGPLHGFTAAETGDPLFTLLHEHGDEVIDALESAADRSILVRRVLWRLDERQGHPITQHDIPRRIWNRVRRATARTTEFNTDDPPGRARHLAPEHEAAVEAWFAYEASFWAYERLDDLVRNDPDPAFYVIARIAEEAADHAELELLGSGPLEDLMSKHGEAFVDRLVERARHSEAFRFTVSCMWQSGMSDEIWERVREAVEEG